MGEGGQPWCCFTTSPPPVSYVHRHTIAGQFPLCPRPLGLGHTPKLMFTHTVVDIQWFFLMIVCCLFLGCCKHFFSPSFTKVALLSIFDQNSTSFGLLHYTNKLEMADMCLFIAHFHKMYILFFSLSILRLHTTVAHFSKVNCQLQEWIVQFSA